MYKYFFILLLFQKTILASNVLTGVVVDIQNQTPIEGVNITCGEEGTTSNSEGKFEIKPDSDSISFSHIGFENITVEIKNSMYIKMTRKIIETNEIIVRSSLLKSSPFESSSSLAVFTKKDIEDQNFDHFQNAIDQIPNLNFSGGTSRPRYFQIRGIGERSQYFGEGSPNHSVGYEVDGIDLSGIGMVGSTIDINQIEISRGPQTTIFGNNSIAGLITIDSAEPETKQLIKIIHKTGNDNTKNTGMIANLKIFKNLYGRFTVLKNYQNGFRTNKYFDVNNTNKKDETLLRFKINIPIGNNLIVKNTLLHSKMDNGYDAWAPDNNENYYTYSDEPGKDAQETNAFISKLKFKFKKFNTLLKLSSSSTDLIHSYDGDWGNNPFWEDSTTYGFDSYYYGYYLPYQYFDKTSRLKRNTNAEARVYKDNAIVGLYFKNLNEVDEAEGYLFGGEGNVAKADSEYDIKISAAYAQMRTSISNKLKMDNSVRVEFNDISYVGNSFGYSNDTLPAVESNKSYSLNGLKSSISYEIDPHSKIFAHFSYGYKSGGINQQPYVSEQNRVYSPEYLSNFELSFKTKKEKYFVNLSYFYNKRLDQQVSISAQQTENDPNSFYYFTSNSKNAGFSRGAELELKYQIFKNLNIKSSLAYLDTWTSKFSYSIAGDNVMIGGGREAAMSPKLSSSLSINYKHKSIFGSVNHSFKDDYYFSDSHDMMSKEYALTNLSAGKDFGDFKIKAWVNNIFDKRYAIRGFYFGLIPPNYEDKLWLSYGDPRHYGISIEYEFIGPN